MRTAILTSLLISCFHLAWTQTTYKSSIGKPVEKYRTVDLKAQGSSEAFIEFPKVPKPGGDAYHQMLDEQKKKAAQLFPQSNEALPQTRSLIETPEIINTFSGNSFTAGIPLDNHLAVNRNDQIITVVNTHMLVVGPTGVWQEAYSLDDFWSVLGETDFYFDPRVIYDPIADRFILTMMQQGNCAGSNIVFAFSETNDPTGAWNLYQFDGCPNENATFADYPMMALTQDELFFTYNAVYEDSTWQSGFNETFIYQINKADGYAGLPLNWRSWSDITHNNRKLRYIHPVKYAMEDLGTELYFLSNRSFDIQNDTIFMVHINGNMAHPNLELNVQAMRSDAAYGVPPNAQQPKDFLQTNDARVLDAFYVEDHIQFVSNTMDPLTGRSGVYHGIITDVSIAPSLHATILRNGSEHFAYPGISHTGASPDEHDAIIIASHASMTRYPGYSALYYNNGHSDWIAVKEGDRNIDMLKVGNPFGLDPTLERWGDYSGIQRQYAVEGEVWTASSYGKPGSVNDTWIGHLRRPEKSSSNKDIDIAGTLEAFPNPAHSIVTMEIDVPAKGKLLDVTVHDMQGKPIRNVYSRKLVQDGPVKFYFHTKELVPGTYILQAKLDGKAWTSKQIVVQ